MAIRTIRTIGDDVLRKKCKEVTEITKREITLINDMIDTMFEANGVGLAAPQVGILKRIFVERPNYVKVKALNEKGEEFVLEGEGLLARAVLHENDHLNGVLYVDLAK